MGGRYDKPYEDIINRMFTVIGLISIRIRTKRKFVNATIGRIMSWLVLLGNR